MTEEFLATKPIYLQIVERICQKIIREELKSGEKLPSVREMAIQSGVNPNTIQRTYGELERMDIVETRRGQGTFVTENIDVLKQLKDQMKTEIVETYVKSMQELGFTKGEMLEGLEHYLGWDKDDN
ncbi:GntR family transcriptional regulator [Heyndrickxia sp. FSL K6-6286]|uniref:GntR family transcriptional regulator n=1 Tax=Heyndrickxia sp. FSL K6-6286 TaxID=2921510 RepID=UPI003159D644